MKWTWMQLTILVVGLMPRVARAQGMNRPASALMGFPVDSLPASGQHGVLPAVILLGVTTLVLVAIAKLVDFRKHREEQVVELEVRISSALLEDRSLFRSSVAPKVRIPVWRGSPAVITLAGGVASAHDAQLALRLAGQAAWRVRPDFTIVNQMAVASANSTAKMKGEAEMPSRLVGALKALTSFVGVVAGVILIKYAFLIEHVNFK